MEPASSTGATGPTGPQGIQGNTGPTGPTNTTLPIGNTLRVDAVYGNDTAAAASRYTTAFLTISAALALAVSGENVILNAGVYIIITYARYCAYPVRKKAKNNKYILVIQ